MLYMEALATERSIGEYKRVVAQIHDAINELPLQKMSKYFKVNKQG